LPEDTLNRGGVDRSRSARSVFVRGGYLTPLHPFVPRCGTPARLPSQALWSSRLWARRKGGHGWRGKGRFHLVCGGRGVRLQRGRYGDRPSRIGQGSRRSGTSRGMLGLIFIRAGHPAPPFRPALRDL